MRHQMNGHQEMITKINVTPIIDVALVLVIILLVTAPLLSITSLSVDLPVARTREAEEEKTVTITLTSAGALAVDEDRVSLETLGGVLRGRLAGQENGASLVVVRADAGVPHSSVRRVLEEASEAGAVRLAIATRQKTERAR